MKKNLDYEAFKKLKDYELFKKEYCIDSDGDKDIVADPMSLY